MLTKDAIVEYYPNGQLEWNIPIEWHVVGVYRRHGEAVQYYPTGEVKIRRTYKHGKEMGDEVMYYRDGSIMSRLTFKNGKKEGPYVFNHPDGSREEAAYEGGELKEGSIRHFDKDGKEKARKNEILQRDRDTGAKKIMPGDHIPAHII